MGTALDIASGGGVGGNSCFAGVGVGCGGDTGCGDEAGDEDVDTVCGDFAAGCGGDAGCGDLLTVGGGEDGCGVLPAGCHGCSSCACGTSTPCAVVDCCLWGICIWIILCG